MAGLRQLLVAVLLLAGGCAQPEPGNGTTTGAATVTAGIGDTVGHYRIQEIHADRVEGLDRYPYPVLQGDGEPRTLRVGDVVGAACEGTTYTLASIDAAVQRVTFTENRHEPQPGGCPICLSGETRIDTPAGPVNVKEVRVGDLVWALVEGRRQAMPVDAIGQTAALDHTMVRLVLEDGRTLDASAGHPLPDGRSVGELAPGDLVDGSTVRSAVRVAYTEAFTYDLRAGDGYWANGILLASTLA